MARWRSVAWLVNCSEEASGLRLQPSLAHQALNADRRIGVLLPCNVVVRTEAS